MIPDEATRLAALKRGEIDIAYSIRGELAEELQRTPGLTIKPAVGSAPFWLYFPEQWDPKSPWHDRRVRQAANLALDRKTHERGADARLFAPDRQHLPGELRLLLAAAGAGVRSGARAASCWPRPGMRGGFDAGDYYCDASYANIGEVVLNNLREVGIRVKLRPLERAAFFKAYSEKKLKNIVQGASGAFGNCATRAEAFVVKGGAYVYGSYPDIDELFAEQAAQMDRAKREAILHQPAAARAREDDLCADLAARLHLRRRPAGRAIGLRADQGLRLHGALSKTSRSRARPSGSPDAVRQSRTLMKQYHHHRARVGYSLLSLFLLSLTIFLFVRVTGDPVSLLVEPGASPDDIEAMRRQFGLDQPLWVQYGHFMASLSPAISASPSTTARRCWSSISSACRTRCCWRRWRWRLSLLIGIPSGILAAVRVGGFWDSAGKIFSLLGLSLPSVLGRPGADPVLLGLSRLAALLRLRQRRCIC